MTLTRRLKLTIPFIVLFLLLSLLWHQLYSANSNNYVSSMTGESVPDFSMPNLYSPDDTFTPNDFHGHAVLLNVWASWCSACKAEHAMLMKIKDDYHVPIYGILYRDNSTDAMNLLKQRGNPYTMVGNDSNGDASVDLGIYGTPETFVINPSGKIIYRHIGVITQNVWDEIIYPLIEQYEK